MLPGSVEIVIGSVAHILGSELDHAHHGSEIVSDVLVGDPVG
ncbi:hypothetical protein SAMN03159288_04643 [Rhizobium sp. NFACC06-2]|nr:hypothetical protein SAMN03159288_04643 [Rhizobium sp. NFACC06-2]